MAITNGYCTLSDLKGELGISNTDADTRLERVIEAVSRFIDRTTGQFFYDAGTQTRVYTPISAHKVIVDPLQSIDTLKTDPGDDDTFEMTWDTSDYRLEPRNAALASPAQPYTRVRAVGRWFPLREDSVEIAGTFGWAAIPLQVQEACLIQSSRIQKRKDSPFGIADVPSFDGGGMQIRNMDPDVKQLLAPFVRPAAKGWVL